jgi:hypothetical protein
MESRIQEAIEHIEQYPGTPVAGVAREFNVPRRRLRNRLEGIPPKMGYVGVNLIDLLGQKRRPFATILIRLIILI